MINIANDMIRAEILALGMVKVAFLADIVEDTIVELDPIKISNLIKSVFFKVF